MQSKKKNKIVAVSGGFDPVHVGHIRMFREAKKLGDKLVIILNNDNWLKKKKRCVFMPQHERKELLESIKNVHKVVLSQHGENPEDMSVCVELADLKPDVFVNGGDRKLNNVPEVGACKEISCDMVFNLGRGGKVQSSSWLLGTYAQNINYPRGSRKKQKKHYTY